MAPTFFQPAADGRTMETLRTPDGNFADLPGVPDEGAHVAVDGIRLGYVE